MEYDHQDLLLCRELAMKRDSGFTFVELLVVISIIGIIFATGVVTYTSISVRSRDARRKTDLESIRQSLEICRSLAGSYPDTIYNSVTCDDATSTVMLASTPLDPKPCTGYTNGRYTYVKSTSVTYTLTANCIESGTYVVTNP